MVVFTVAVGTVAASGEAAVVDGLVAVGFQVEAGASVEVAAAAHGNPEYFLVLKDLILWDLDVKSPIFDPS